MPFLITEQQFRETAEANAAAAERVAAKYDYDADDILFQINRRSFGSLSTTSLHDELPMLWAALKLPHVKSKKVEAA